MTSWHISFIALPFLFAFAIYGEVLKRRIPNVLTLAAMAFGLGAALIENGLPGLKESALGLLIGGGVFLPFCLFGLVGGGDMKLMAATGAIIGYPLVLRALTDTCIAGGLLAVGIAAWNGTLLSAFASAFRIIFGAKRKRDEKKPEASAEDAGDARHPLPVMIPYGLAIAAGTLYTIFTGA